MLAGERAEARLVEHVAHEFLVGGHGRRPRLLVQQRHFTKHRAGREGGQALFPGLTGKADLHARRALADHEQAPVGVSLLDDDTWWTSRAPQRPDAQPLQRARRNTVCWIRQLPDVLASRSSWREPADPSRPSAGASWTALRRARSLFPPSRVALPRSALGVALLQHAALVPGRHYVLTDQTGRKKDQPSVHMLARAAVEIELSG